MPEYAEVVQELMLCGLDCGLETKAQKRGENEANTVDLAFQIMRFQ